MGKEHLKSGKSILGRGNKTKVSAVGASLVCSRNSKEVRVAGMQNEVCGGR